MKRVAVPQLALAVWSLVIVGSGTQAELCAAHKVRGQHSRDRGSASIVESGSTNADGFRILVERTGKTELIVLPRNPPRQPVELPVPRIGTIPAALAKRLYSDLDKSWPLSSLPKRNCPKSASFGTTLTIEFDYQTTPDLSCGGGTSANLQALVQDARQIVSASGKQQTTGQ